MLYFFPTPVAPPLTAICRARDVNKTKFWIQCQPVGQFMHQINFLFLLPIERCNSDVKKFEAEAAKWHSQFVTYVTVSTLVTFLSITATICYCKRPQVTTVIRRYRGGEQRQENLPTKETPLAKFSTSTLIYLKITIKNQL